MLTLFLFSILFVCVGLKFFSFKFSDSQGSSFFLVNYRTVEETENKREVNIENLETVSSGVFGSSEYHV